MKLEYLNHHYCINCHKNISHYIWKYGNKRCRSCAKKGKLNPNFGNPKKLIKQSTSQWKGGLPNCIDCEKKLNDYRSKRCKQCAGKKHSKWLKKLFKNPKNHFRYVNGRGYEDYPLEFNSILKEKIRQRDNYVCQICRKKHNIVANKEEKMHVHHIDYNKQNCKKK